MEVEVVASESVDGKKVVKVEGELIVEVVKCRGGDLGAVRKGEVGGLRAMEGWRGGFVCCLVLRRSDPSIYGG